MPRRSFRFAPAALLLAAGLRFASPAAAASDQIDLSEDLVRLGIAAQNLTPDDPTLDARPLFQATLAYAAAHGTRALTVDRGKYYFLTAEDATTYLRFPGLTDLSVDLAGSTVYFATSFLQGFALANCQRVTLANFTVDFLALPYTEVQLTQVDAQGRSLSYATLPGWPDPTSFNDVTAPGGAAIVSWAVAFHNHAIAPGTSRMHVAQPISAGVLQLVQDNTPWTQPATLATLAPGDTIVVTFRGGSPPIDAFHGSAIVISNVTVHASGAIAVLLNSVSDSIVDNVHVEPRPSAGLIASNADGIHLVNSGARNHIRHSFVTRTLDDAIAIDSLDPATVTNIDGPQQLTVQRTAYMQFPVETAVDFVDAATGAEIAGATIIAEDPADTTPPVFDGSVSLTFDRNLPTLAAGFGVAFAAPDQRGAGSSINDNTVADILFGRGIWVGGAEGVTVSGNRIGHTSNGGIAIAQDTTSYPLPPARHIAVLNNQLHGSLGPMASGSGTQIATGAILVDSTTLGSAFATSPVNTDVTIARNSIVNSGRSGLWIEALAGGAIRDNVIDGWNRQPNLPLFGVNAATAAQLRQDFTQAIVTHDSTGLHISENTLMP